MRMYAVVYGISPFHSNCMKSDNPNSGIYVADTSRTLDALNCGYPGCNQGGMAVVQPIPYGFDPSCSRDVGKYFLADCGNTLTNGTCPGHHNGVLQPILDDQGGSQISVRHDGKCPTLRAEAHGNLPCVMNVAYSINHQGGNVEQIIEDKTGTLTASMNSSGNNKLSVAYSIENHPADSRVDIDPTGKVQTLTSRMGTGGGNVPMVMEPVVYESHPQDSRVKELGGVMPTVSSKWHKGAADTPLVMETFHAAVYEDCSPPLKARDYKDPHIVAGVDCRNATEYPEMNATLQSNAAHNLNSNNVVRVKHIVRRLTPLECERLQGFPDGWTDIGEWVDSNGKKHKEADSPRYKALGNSIALPPWKWVLKRLCACYERDATMASLFDGIGGFPLIWEQINGKGSCLWSSEIEEFPMAVTKVRFGE